MTSGFGSSRLGSSLLLASIWLGAAVRLAAQSPSAAVTAPAPLAAQASARLEGLHAAPVAVAVDGVQAVVAVEMQAGPSVAPASQQANEPQPSTYDRIWRFAEWYDNPKNPVVQRVLLSGRYQHEYAAVDADQGDWDEWNVRRLRVGPRLTMFQTWTVHGEVELNPQETDPFYVRFTDLYVQWTKSARFAVTVGKQGVPFTIDGATSSKELLSIDRSNLSNNIWFPQEYMPGVSVSGRRDRWNYRLGGYSAGEANRELGEFSGSGFALAVLGYDFAKSLDVRRSLVSVNYVFQDPDRRNTFTRQLHHIASLNWDLEAGGWGLRADVSAASGALSQGDILGVMIMPFVNLTRELQLVGRYTGLDSDDANAIRLATYENRIVSGRGDRYDELYLGANYYFYGHKLKLQTGLQVADMDDIAGDGGAYSGVSWTAGLRVSW